MTTITLKGNPVYTAGRLPSPGKTAPDFTLVKQDLTEMRLSELRGKRVVMNIFPSIETSVCATALRKFNEKAAGLNNTVVLAISKDLPLALKRFCAGEGITNVIPLSAFRDASFGRKYGVEILNGDFQGLFARSVVVLNENGKVIYTEQVPEIGQEPNYEAALDVL